ncbi:PREDICTED: tensin-4 [Gavialis gangeticus]|uniref:tensin-4 n=1 Tax=Gavialis gangeticus TaxID=94835 RepID=UPI00092ECB42|nr:PREDICTED: tensin-4 [Gavialis gangeticus]
MSQVLTNHVLQVGQTICVTSQEESQSLHPAGCPCCPTRSAKCSCYSTEGWVGQPTMTQTKTHLHPNGGLHGTNSNAVFKHMTSQAQGKEHQVIFMERPSLAHQSKGDDESDANPEASPVSPTLDVSIESLNQLILEIDPTFQPLAFQAVNGKKDAVQASPLSNKSVTKQQESEALDIKYIEMTPTRAKCYESLQGSGSPSMTPLSRSPQGHCLLLQRRTPQPNCSPNGSVVFSSPSASDSARAVLQNNCSLGSYSKTSNKASECISIPQRGQRDCISYGPTSLLSTSPGFDNLRKPLHAGRGQQRTSAVSQLSASPGSDTSYMLGSSTPSLLNDDSETHFSTDSSWSVGSLGSPYSASPTVKVDHLGEGFSPGSYQPNGNQSQTVNVTPSTLLQKGQASSCPPSIINSMSDIPILLVNGCLEHSKSSPRLTKGHHDSTKKAVPPNSSPTSGLSSLINTSSDSSLFSSMDSTSKDGQPTMKFVMDTSKYWFKPSITREQAIELLKDKEPGTFVMRDSTSYRGSFGLAMKVLVSPSSSRTDDDNCDLVRHFLIESSAKGVHLKGANEEPYFGSLSAFVYQHAIMQLSLPSKLIIPSRDLADGDSSPDTTPESVLAALKKAAVCNVLYLNSVSMETLTGAPAIQKAITCTLELETPPMPTIVHFKATEQGITLTDVQRKVFFRRHYPLAIISFCSMDPDNRKWQKYCKSSRIFGFVAKSQTDSENVCHLFAEYDTVQPASLVIDFVSKLLPEP